MKMKIVFIFLIFSIIIFCKDIEILNYEDVKEGEVGVSYTVFEGEKIEEFYVEIIKKLSGEGEISDFFLVNVYGDNLKKSKGILEGMSGSPVYVRGKLIGALSYTLDGDVSKSGIVTPIKYMHLDSEIGIEEEKITLKPGSAITISPVFGDIAIDEIGTLTYIKNNKFGALGHPVTNKGDVSFFLGRASIDYSFHTQKLPYKVGHMDEIIGEVLRDEKSGVYGDIKNDVKTYNFEVEFLEKKIEFKMPKNRKTLELYLARALNMAINKFYETDDVFTGEYTYELYKENKLVYSDNNFVYINENFNEEFSNIISNDILTIVDNPFLYLEFDNVKLNFNLNSEKKIVFLKGLNIDKKIFKLGEDIELSLLYYVYQKGFAEEFIKIKVPEDFKIGNANVKVLTNSPIKKEIEEINSLEEYLELKRWETANNEVIVILESELDNKKTMLKTPFEYYIVYKKEFEENIIIDSFEADIEGIENVK